MRVCIHRGSHQIGGSCVEIEQNGLRILLDFGLPLDSDHDKHSAIPATLTGLNGRDTSVLGVFISHPHLDHFGLLPALAPSIPVGMGPAARRIVTAAAAFSGPPWTRPAAGWDYRSGQRIDVGPFRVTPFLVDHSAYDAYALLIESQEQSLFYSGDFRAHGRKSALFESLLRTLPRGIDALLLEGSTLGRPPNGGRFQHESDIEDQFVAEFSSAQGLVLTHTSSQNIDRLVSIFRAARRTNRLMVIDLYTAAILQATGNPNIPQSHWPDIRLYVPQRQRMQIRSKGLFDLLRQHAKHRIYIEELCERAKSLALVFRPIHCQDLEKANCLADARYIYSQWAGYWEHGDFSALGAWLNSHGIDKRSIHTSGHASPVHLEEFARVLTPRKVAPIHTFVPQQYQRLFVNVELHRDGEWWTLEESERLEHAERTSPANKKQQHWRPGLEEQKIGKFKIVPLTSSKQLKSEGWHMMNCVANYSNACKKDEYRVFSIRDLSGERLATLGMIRKNNQWWIDQCFGPCNSAENANLELVYEHGRTREMVDWYQDEGVLESDRDYDIENGVLAATISVMNRYGEVDHLAVDTDLSLLAQEVERIMNINKEDN
ncbi:MAG: PcfJ domain-containing protein [Lamprobacter sp.]|uniref:MBL fold metallo-hydrolase n=1 Tax=Lamprobacter sp. TaxID=3100796 RepID=UPI002B25D48E|nr:PcfJ domain-containing protein [Lamprobacter sp.]MEA3642569.1 PcfJ domain-containing protein [Lamprobacter sp.]